MREKEKGRKGTGKEKILSHSNSSMHLSINQTEPLCSSVMITELVKARSRDKSESVNLDPSSVLRADFYIAEG